MPHRMNAQSPTLPLQHVWNTCFSDIFFYSLDFNCYSISNQLWVISVYFNQTPKTYNSNGEMGEVLQYDTRLPRLEQIQVPQRRSVTWKLWFWQGNWQTPACKCHLLLGQTFSPIQGVVVNYKDLKRLYKHLHLNNKDSQSRCSQQVETAGKCFSQQR